VGEPFVCVAVKPVAPVTDVDWLTGRARLDERHLVRTPADAAACAVGASIAAGLGHDVVVAAVAGPASLEVLRIALAEGARRALRVVVGDEDVDDADPALQWPSEVVAGALEVVCTDASVVVCGDASGDRASGTVPSLLAQRLGVPQALGLRAASFDDGRIYGVRRLDAGRRERLAIEPRCVISVEAGAAAPSRAPLPRVVDLAAGRVAVAETRVAVPAGARRGDTAGTVLGPYRPRASQLAPPAERDPVRRAIEVAGTLSRRDPPELLRCDPEEAAIAILERLERWGSR
jgi:electron transfer flavoprotein beta subunit